MPPSPFIAVDIGNSRVKIGLFTGASSDVALQDPLQTLELSAATFDTRKLDVWLGEAIGRVNTPPLWWIASVNRPLTELLAAWLQERGAIEFEPGRKIKRPSLTPNETRSAFCRLKHSDLPIVVSLSEPGRVGIDRLLGAVAVNRLRAAARAAIVIDVGSAITVDVVSPRGAFLGGAILPGIGMSARAMHEFTDLLPLLPMDELVEPPPALGTSTLAAMQSGLYWGAIGAMKELIARLADEMGQQSGGKALPEVYLTGGAAPSVARFVDPGATFVPHLVLGGIGLVAQQ